MDWTAGFQVYTKFSPVFSRVGKHTIIMYDTT